MIENFFLSNPYLLIFWECLGALLGVTFFALALGDSKKMAVTAGFMAFFGWGIYTSTWHKIGIVPAAFLSSAFIAWCAQEGSRILKGPVTLFLIPALASLVPGMQLFQMVVGFITGDSALATRKMIETLSLALSIALGVIMVEALYIMKKGIVQRIKKKKSSQY